MQTEIERLVKQVRELQAQQSTIIGRLRELEENAIADGENNTEEYCYDRYNNKISINDRIYLVTKGKLKVRVGKVTRVDHLTKWVTIELDTGQITTRKSYNTKVL